MKKRILAILLAALTVLLVACSSGSSDNEVSFYNWGGTMKNEVLHMFEEETGIKIVYSEFDENENMYTVLKNNPSDYDLIVPSDYMVEKMINEDMLREIDTTQLENFDEIGEVFLNKSFDPGNVYSVPMYYGTVGILYNKTLVDQADLVDWQVLFNEKYSQQIWMMDSSRDSMAAAYWHLGYSANDTDPAKLEEAKQLLIEQKPLVSGYLNDEMKQHMVNNNGAMALVYSGEAREAMAENSDLDYYLPTVSNLWIDNFAIPKDAPNYENALKLIDFLSRPEIAAMNGDEQGTVIDGAREIEPTKSIEYFEVIYPDMENMDEKEVYADFGDFTEAYENAWEEVKSN